MNGEGQRPPAPPDTAQASTDAPEPGNARYPQPGMNGNANAQFGPGQESQGGGRRRFRRNRRGGRGRRGKGQGQGQVAPPLDAQGRILDVENDGGAQEGPVEEGPAEGTPQPAEAQPAGDAAAQAVEGGAPQQQTRPPQQQQHRHPQQQRPQQQPRHEPAQPVEGVLDVDHRGNGRLRNPKYNFLPQQDDVDVPRHTIDRDHLRPGVMLTGQAVRRNGRLQLIKTDSVEGLPPQEVARRTAFQNLTVVDPDDRVVLETTSKELLTRVIDIVAPIGLGQRMLIVAPPKTGKTIMLQKICHAITQNRPEVQQMVLLVDERPEEVTDFRRTVKADVFASSSDRPTDEHIHVAEVVLERAKRLVEGGKDVVILLDSITRLSRAYNKEVESSGRTLSGGIDSRALERPKRFFGAARNAEEGGSLTIVATALIDTGSRMDEVIFEEFKGTGNSEVVLDRRIAERRTFPAIDVQRTSTRKEELLLSKEELNKIYLLRNFLADMPPVEAIEFLLERLKRTKNNAEFFQTMAQG